MSVEEVEEVDKKILEPGYFFFNAVTMEIISVIAMILFTMFRTFLTTSLEDIFLPGIFISAGFFLTLIGVCKYGYRIVSLCTPQKRMRKAANGILDALIQSGKLEEPLHCRAVTEETEAAAFVYLKGGNTRDKTLLRLPGGILGSLIIHDICLFERRVCAG